MLKKLSVIALLALVIIPAGVMAAGTQARGEGSGTMSAGGQQFQQQSDGSQSLQGQNSLCNQNGFEISADKGNGTLTRNRTCEQIQLRITTQLQSQSHLQTRITTQSQNNLQGGIGSGTEEQLQTRIQQQLCTMTRDQLKTMTRLQSKLMDGSCGNCPKLATVTV